MLLLRRRQPDDNNAYDLALHIQCIDGFGSVSVGLDFVAIDLDMALCWGLWALSSILLPIEFAGYGLVSTAKYVVWLARRIRVKRSPRLMI